MPDVHDLRQRSTLLLFLITDEHKQRSATKLEEIPADYLSNSANWNSKQKLFTILHYCFLVLRLYSSVTSRTFDFCRARELLFSKYLYGYVQTKCWCKHLQEPFLTS